MKLLISVDKDIDILKLKEEYETAKSQIDFLNSVIVDMQRKNETLLCKVEVLEMGIPSNEANEYTKFVIFNIQSNISYSNYINIIIINLTILF